jgi:hypothetical protein
MLQTSQGQVVQVAMSPAQMSPVPSRAANAWLAAAWRFVTIGAFAFWQGGFTFYGAVVIQVAPGVFGSHVPVGFITQRVSNWLNLIGAITLLILLCNLLIARSRISRRLMWGLTASWVIMAILLIAQVYMHPMLDRLLDPRAMEITDYERFDRLHKFYLNFASVQWAAAMVHFWCLMWL